MRIAVSKGRTLEETNALLLEAGIISEEIKEGRKLILDDSEKNLSFILAKPMDVPVYVQYGVADLGIVGKDVLYENGENFYELLDLKIASCKLSLCGYADSTWQSQTTIASKYPNFTRKFFRSRGRQVDIIKLNGSVELAPILGLSDFIVDIVSSGQTLEENGLKELEVLDEISCRLIANPSTYHLKTEKIESLVASLRDFI